MVEGDVKSLCALGGALLTEVSVLVLVKIIHVELALRGNGGKYSGGVWSPRNITDLRFEIEGNNWSLHVLDPHLDGPISTATQEGVWMEGVPFDSINCEVMVFVRLKVLSRVCLGAKMDLTFFSSDKEEMVSVLVEVEAHATCVTVKEGFFLAVIELLLLVNNEFKFDDLLWLELVLHEVPVGNTTI